MYSGVHVRYPRTSRDTLGLGHMEMMCTEVWDTLGLGHMEMMCTEVWDTLGLEIVYTALGVGYPWTSQDIQGYSGTGTYGDHVYRGMGYSGTGTYGDRVYRGVGYLWTSQDILGYSGTGT